MRRCSWLLANYSDYENRGSQRLGKYVGFSNVDRSRIVPIFEVHTDLHYGKDSYYGQ